MCASLNVCQDPTSVSMYLSSVSAQPFGILGCFFPGLEAGASHWSYSHSRVAFPAGSLLDITVFCPFHLFFLPFSNPPFAPLQSVAGAVLPPGVALQANREGTSCFLEKLFFCCLLALCVLQKTLINKQISLPKKENQRGEAQHSEIFGIFKKVAAASWEGVLLDVKCS